jgi:hypothetical protein
MRTYRVGRAVGTRRAAVVAAGAGAAVLLAGCGGAASTSAKPASGTSSTASATTSTGTTTSTGSGKAAAASLQELARRSSAATRAASTARMSMSAGPTAAAARPVANARIRFGASTTDMALDLLGATATKLVVLKGAVYVAAGQPIGGKHWIKIDPNGKDRVSKAVAPLLSSMTGNLDTTAQLAHMPDAKLASATATTVNGVPVTKYVVTMTERDLLSVTQAFHMPAEVKKQTEAALKGAHGTSTLYLDGNDLPLRAESLVTGTARENSATVVTYSGWGEPVSITAPPATDVVDPGALGG